MWTPKAPGIGHDNASAGIDGDAIRTDQAAEIRLAGDEVEHAGPEAALGLDLAL